MRWAQRFIDILVGGALVIVIAGCEIPEQPPPEPTGIIEVQVPASFTGYRGEIRHYAGEQGKPGHLISEFEGYFPVGESIPLADTEGKYPDIQFHWEVVEVVLESRNEQRTTPPLKPTLEGRRAEARSDVHDGAWAPNEWSTMVADLWIHLRTDLPPLSPEDVAEQFDETQAQLLFESPDYERQIEIMAASIAE